MATAVDSIRTTVVQTNFQPFVFRRPSHLVEASQAHTIDDVRKLDILNAGTDIGSADRCSMPMDAWTYADACHGATPTLLPASAALPGSGGLKVLTVSDLASDQIRHDIVFEGVQQLDTFDHARTIHIRRELHQALDYGFALLDALDLQPLALDVIDDAIATLDALDAPDEDREDGGDAELALGWCEMLFTQSRLGDPSDDLELTALERNGHGFVQTSADDAEQDDPPEDDDGAGDEDSGIGDDDGMAEQLAGWSHCPALAFSNGGYVG